jgi:hypothetical protein
MKHLITLLLIAIPFFSFSQTTTTTYLSSGEEVYMSIESDNSIYYYRGDTLFSIVEFEGDVVSHYDYTGELSYVEETYNDTTYCFSYYDEDKELEWYRVTTEDAITTNSFKSTVELDNVYISSNKLYLDSGGVIVSVEVFYASGRLVIEEYVNATSFTIPNLPHEVYILRLEVENGFIIKKILI